MNNTKWRRLFGGIQDAEISLPHCRIKFLRHDHAFTERTPTDDVLNADSTRDCFLCGPFFFRDIEWMEWSASYEVSRGPGLEHWVRSQGLLSLGEAD